MWYKNWAIKNCRPLYCTANSVSEMFWHLRFQFMECANLSEKGLLLLFFLILDRHFMIVCLFWLPYTYSCLQNALGCLPCISWLRRRFVVTQPILPVLCCGSFPLHWLESCKMGPWSGKSLSNCNHIVASLKWKWTFVLLPLFFSN